MFIETSRKQCLWNNQKRIYLSKMIKRNINTQFGFNNKCTCTFFLNIFYNNLNVCFATELWWGAVYIDSCCSFLMFNIVCMLVVFGKDLLSRNVWFCIVGVYFCNYYKRLIHFNCISLFSTAQTIVTVCQTALLIQTCARSQLKQWWKMGLQMVGF